MKNEELRIKNEETRSRRERAQNTAGRSEGLSQSPAIDERERAELAARAGQRAAIDNRLKPKKRRRPNPPNLADTKAGGKQKAG